MGSGPPWGLFSAGAPLTKILDPHLLMKWRDRSLKPCSQIHSSQHHVIKTGLGQTKTEHPGSGLLTASARAGFLASLPHSVAMRPSTRAAALMSETFSGHKHSTKDFSTARKLQHTDCAVRHPHSVCGFLVYSLTQKNKEAIGEKWRRNGT